MSLVPLGRAIAMVGMVAGVSSVAVTSDSSSTPSGADVAYEVWQARPGQSLGDIAVGEPPDAQSVLGGAFEGPQNIGNEYGVRLRAIFTPAKSGAYRFFLSSDDDSRLFVNPTGTDPSGSELAAFVAGWTTPYQWDRFASQRSRAYELTAGTEYYVEAIGKEGHGDDHLAVGMQVDEGSVELIPSELIEATALGAGGWRSLTPYGLDGHPVATDAPGWEVVNSAHTLEISWAGVADADDYVVRLEGSGEVRVVETVEPAVRFDDLVPLTRYLVEVTPRDASGASAPMTTVLFTDLDEFPVPVDPVEGNGGGVAFDRWDVGWWTLTSIPEGQPPAATTNLSYGLEAPVNMGPNVGKRIRAVLTPTRSGDYTFHLASDDDGRLLFNPSGPTADGARIIASVSGWTEQYQWDRYESQRSPVFTLEAGEQYYIEAVSVQGLDVDHMEVGWSRPGTDITVVPNDVLSPTDEGAGGWRSGPPTVDARPTDPSTTDTTDTTVPGADPSTTETSTTVPGADPSTTETSTTVPGADPSTTVPEVASSPTAAPVYTGDVDMTSYGLLAVGTGTCAGIEMTAGSVSTGGAIRSNGDIVLQGGDIDVGGPVSYGGTTNLSGNVAQHDPVPVEAGPAFDLGLVAAAAAGHEPDHVHPEGLSASRSIASGLHYVVGDVTISGGRIDLTGVSILATGTIHVSGGSITLSPVADGVPVLYSAADSCDDAAIDVSTAELDWQGTIVAIDGMVRTTASHVSGGDIVAAAIRGSASSLRFD